MNKYDQVDRLLQEALAPTESPSNQLNQSILNRMQEEQPMKTISHKRAFAIALAAALVLALSITGFASWRFLSAKEVAKQNGMSDVARAFEGGDAVSINQSITSGAYNFTFLGIVSGKNLSEFQSDPPANPKRTYAVMAIARTDGTSVASDGSEQFFVSPLIKGQRPWQVNIASMNGAYTEFVEKDVLYRLIECDDMELFADRGLYLCVSTSAFYDIKAFDYDEQTGEVTPNDSYDGACALFDLPLDPRKADHEKADDYLETLLNPPEREDSESSDPEIDSEELKKAVAQGTVLPGSEKEVTYDEDGMACYEFDGCVGKFLPEAIFEDGQTGPSDMMSVSENGDGTRIVTQYSRDENGVITGKTVRIDP